MIKSLVVVLTILGSTAFLSATFFGYPRSGKQYVQKQRKNRKSLRMGSVYFLAGYGLRSRSFRSGK